MSSRTITKAALRAKASASAARIQMLPMIQCRRRPQLWFPGQLPMHPSQGPLCREGYNCACFDALWCRPTKEQLIVPRHLISLMATPRAYFRGASSVENLNAILYTASDSLVVRSFTPTQSTSSIPVMIGTAVSSSTPAAVSLNGTTDQITVSMSGTAITLSTPQPLAQTSSPTFATITANSATAFGAAYFTTAKALASTGAMTAGQLLIGTSATTNPVLGSITGTAGALTVTNSSGTITLTVPAACTAITTLSNVTSINGGVFRNGTSNTCIGAGAYNDTLLTDLVAIGPGAAAGLTGSSGSNSIFIGKDAGGGYSGSGFSRQQVNIGAQAGKYATAADNCYIGYAVGRGATGTNTGSANTAVGNGSMIAITLGSSDSAFGNNVMINLSSGSNNTSVGDSSGNTLNTGGTCTLLGASADVSAENASNRTALGYQAVADTDSGMVFGNASVTEIKPGGDAVASLGTAARRWTTGYFSTGVRLGVVSPGTAATLSGHEQAYAHSTTVSGPWASAQTCNMTITMTGPKVTLNFPAVSSTSSSLSTITMVDALPARFRPAADKSQVMLVTDNGVTIAGICHITASTGVIVLQRALAEQRFTASGLAGFPSQSVCFDV